MKIFLMRHGEASWDAPSDFERRLTDRGRQQVVDNVLLKRDDLETVDCFITSPYLRAQQTAALAINLLEKPQTPISEKALWLQPDSGVEEALEQLALLSCSSLLLFSHLPFANLLVESLCGFESGFIQMNTANIVAIEFSDELPVASGLGTLLWQL